MAKNVEVTLKANTRQFDRSIQTSERNLSNFSRTGSVGFGKMAAAIGGVVAAAKGLQGVVTTGAKFQDLQDSLNAVFGSAKQGEAAFKRIKDFSLRTQFGVDTLTNAFIQLKGAGVEPTEELLMTFADTASVTTDQMGTFQAALDLVSRSTAGGLGLEDLNRLADRGIPVFQILQEKLGLARLEVSEFGKTTEGANKIIAALTAGLNERFGGTLQTKLDNVSVKFSNLKIAVQNLASEIFYKLEPALSGMIDELTEGVIKATEFVAGFKDISDVFAELRTNVEPIIQFLKDFNAIVAALVAPALVSGVVLITRRIVGVAKAFASVLAPAIRNVIFFFLSLRKIAIVGIAGIVIKVAELISNLSKVNDTLTNKVINGFKIFANTVVGIMAGIGETVIQALINPFREIGEFLQDPLNYNLPSFSDMGQALAEAFNKGFANGAQLFEIPEEYKEIQDNFQDLSLDFGDIEVPELEGITDLGFIMEDQAAKVATSVANYKSSLSDLAKFMKEASAQIQVTMLETLGRAQKALSEDLATALMEGRSAMDSFKKFFKTIATQLIAETLRLMVIQPILSSIFGAFNMPISFSAGGMPSFRANGGPVMKNKPYIVGEEGPELFVPGASGSIVPNDRLAGGTTYITNISAVDTQSFQQALARDPEFIYNVSRAGARRTPA